MHCLKRDAYSRRPVLSLSMLEDLTKSCEDAIELDTTIFIEHFFFNYSTQHCFKLLETLKRTASFPANMLSGNCKLVTPCEKAEAFNAFFCSVFTKWDQVFNDYSDRAHNSISCDIYDIENALLALVLGFTMFQDFFLAQFLRKFPFQYLNCLVPSRPIAPFLSIGKLR